LGTRERKKLEDKTSSGKKNVKMKVQIIVEMKSFLNQNFVMLGDANGEQHHYFQSILGCFHFSDLLYLRIFGNSVIMLKVPSILNFQRRCSTCS